MPESLLFNEVCYFNPRSSRNVRYKNSCSKLIQFLPLNQVQSQLKESKIIPVRESLKGKNYFQTNSYTDTNKEGLTRYIQQPKGENHGYRQEPIKRPFLFNNKN